MANSTKIEVAPGGMLVRYIGRELFVSIRLGSATPTNYRPAATEPNFVHENCMLLGPIKLDFFPFLYTILSRTRTHTRVSPRLLLV